MSDSNAEEMKVVDEVRRIYDAKIKAPLQEAINCLTAENGLIGETERVLTGKQKNDYVKKLQSGATDLKNLQKSFESLGNAQEETVWNDNYQTAISMEKSIKHIKSELGIMASDMSDTIAEFKNKRALGAKALESRGKLEVLEKAIKDEDLYEYLPIALEQSPRIPRIETTAVATGDDRAGSPASVVISSQMEQTVGGTSAAMVSNVSALLPSEQPVPPLSPAPADTAILTADEEAARFTRKRDKLVRSIEHHALHPPGGEEGNRHNPVPKKLAEHVLKHLASPDGSSNSR